MNAPSTHSQSAQRHDGARWLHDYGDMLFAYALRRLGDADDAEDAVQDALIAAMKNAKSFRGESTERTWLVGILRHKVLDLIRTRAKHQHSDGRSDLHDESHFANGYWAQRQTTWPELPESSLQRRELREILYRAIDDLPLMMRRAFCLREIDGLDAKEVCQVMNVSPTNLWTLIHRARLQLRKALTKNWFEKGER